jgi:hypothetical protein
VIFFFSEACFALLIAALAILAPLPPLPALVLSILLLGWSFLSAREDRQGRLRRDRIPVLLCLFLLSLSVRLPPADLAGWWPAAVALLLLLCGLFCVLKDRFPWSRIRKEVTLSAVLLLVLSLAVAGMLRGVLAFRSSGAITPGGVGFLLVLPVWLGAWFGLDAHLRRVRNAPRPGAAHWFLNHRHSLGLGICLLVILLRAGLS